jgi:DNA-binding MarR family transcriptional regulator
MLQALASGMVLTLAPMPSRGGVTPRKSLGELTLAQADVLWAADRIGKRQKYPASLTDIARDVGRSKPAVHQSLGQLVLKGYVVRERYQARSLRLTPKAKAWMRGGA